MAKELFVIYLDGTGYIDGGIGTIDREWDEQNKDGSTMLERIPEILAKNPQRRVAFIPFQEIPEDVESIKFVDGKFVPLDDGEESFHQKRRRQEKLISRKMRKLAVKELKKDGELPDDFPEDLE